MPFFFDEGAAQPSGWHGLAQKPPVDWAGGGAPNLLGQ
jgi:hypothetical protein